MFNGYGKWEVGHTGMFNVVSGSVFSGKVESMFSV